MASLPLMTFTVGFCQQMLSNLTEWQNKPPKVAPKLLVVSSGMQEANKEMGLSFPIVLDRQVSAERGFGASDTPSAVLVDKEGKIASELAVGAPVALELAGAGASPKEA